MEENLKEGSVDHLAVPEPGQVARVRSRQYLVEEVVLPSDRSRDQTLVSLSCLDDDAQGVTLQVLWEREVDAVLLRESSWQEVARKGFDPPQLFSAFLHALRWNLVTSTNPRLFQSPYRAGIEVMAYQLEPLRKALLLPRVNLFIADDVGLGKTIEAGLIIRELLMRQKVKRIVVACPASVVLQWRDELESRFGLTFVVLDREFVLKCRRERGYGFITRQASIASRTIPASAELSSIKRMWSIAYGSYQVGALDLFKWRRDYYLASGLYFRLDHSTASSAVIMKSRSG